MRVRGLFPNVLKTFWAQKATPKICKPLFYFSLGFNMDKVSLDAKSQMYMPINYFVLRIHIGKE